MHRKVPFPIHDADIIKSTKKASEFDLKGLCGAEDDLNEPFVRLLMLVRAVNEENILMKEIGEEIEY